MDHLGLCAKHLGLQGARGSSHPWQSFQPAASLAPDLLLLLFQPQITLPILIHTSPLGQICSSNLQPNPRPPLPHPSLTPRRLITALAEAAQALGCYKIILDCAESNVAFYEKCGLARKEVQMVQYFNK